MTGQPYTHAAHAASCSEAARQGHVLAAQHVQIMRRGVLYCAQIVCAWTTPDGVDCWTVQATHPESARFTVPCRYVRLCIRCTCDAPQAASVAQAQRGAEGAFGAPEDLRC